MPFDQGYTNTAIRLDDILKSAVSCIARLDIQNPMVEKCAKFTATLIFMVQSLQMSTWSSLFIICTYMYGN